MPQLSDGFKKQVVDLLKSFVGAVVAAAALAGLNWIGAHLPDAIQYAGMFAAAHGTQKFL